MASKRVIALRQFVAVAAVLCTGPTGADNSPDEWFLLARHGECAQIETLRRKLPDMPKIEDPLVFVEFVASQGYSVESQKMLIAGGSAYQIDVPDLSLNLIFVEKSACTHHPVPD